MIAVILSPWPDTIDEDRDTVEAIAIAMQNIAQLTNLPHCELTMTDARTYNDTYDGARADGPEPRYVSVTTKLIRGILHRLSNADSEIVRPSLLYTVRCLCKFSLNGAVHVPTILSDPQVRLADILLRYLRLGADSMQTKLAAMNFLAYLVNGNRISEENKNKDVCAEHGRGLIVSDIRLLQEIVRIATRPRGDGDKDGTEITAQRTGKEEEGKILATDDDDDVLSMSAAQVLAQLSRCRDTVLPLAMFEHEILIGSMTLGARRADVLVVALSHLNQVLR